MSHNPELAKMLRSYVPYDESLHSTLIRTLLAYDPNIKPIGVIGASGYWVDTPFVTVAQEHIFSRNPDNLLLEMIDMSKSIDGKDNLLFDNPVSYAHIVNATFFSGRTSRAKGKASKKINYCPLCIEEGIREVGYGYFRHFWTFSSVCMIHNKPLHQLPELSFSQSVKAVKQLLRGKSFKGAKVLPHTHGDDFEQQTHDNTWSGDSKYLFPIKFAVGCLMHTFAKWVFGNSETFRDDELRKFAMKVSKRFLFNRDDFHEFEFRKSLAAIYLMCSSLEADKLDAFFSEHVELYRLKLGPRVQGRLREVAAKHKGRDCNSCNEHRCYFKEYQEDTLQRLEHNDISLEYLFENSYTLERIAMQKRPIGRISQSAWAPINVYPQLEEGESLRRMKVSCKSD
ncbi:TniQ family protein [Vibrio astriarenae]|uniref:hypothetical protein n=1 Tax=Vibrio astriarenae TaxID=1481923 RepID=UPI003736A292